MIVLAVCRAALREPLHVIAGNPARVLRLVLVLAARESAADILRRLDIKPIQCRRVRTISLAARMAKAVQVKLKRGLKGRARRCACIERESKSYIGETRDQKSYALRSQHAIMESGSF